MAAAKMAKALIPLADGFEDIEAISIVDVLRRGGVEVVTASIHDRRAVRSAHGVRMEADALFGALVRELDSIELAGEIEPWMTTVGHGPAKVPVRLHFKK